jgi:hypothetical protein
MIIFGMTVLQLLFWALVVAIGLSIMASIDAVGPDIGIFGPLAALAWLATVILAIIALGEALGAL